MKKKTTLRAVLSAVPLLVLAALILAGCSSRNGGDVQFNPPQTDTPTSSTPVDEPLTYTDITLLSAGDVMYHQPQIDEAFDGADGTYDFSDTYKYVTNLVSSADYAVVNYEGTSSGDDVFPYSGYPSFNIPDTGLTILKDAGFDMLLFANNHCYDTGTIGVTRTQEKFTQYGFDYIGARPSAAEGKTYKLVNVKDVNLGMLNSTDDIAYGNTNPRTINGRLIEGDDLERMDIFNLSLLDEFYARAEANINDLKQSGADLIIYYIHWGEEYHFTHNDAQAEIAQKLCDLGVDVIIGGHPHVVEDAEMLTSTVDPSHKTLCYYSLGNYVSNQNRLTMDAGWESEYTENGLTVRLTIRKYSNGETYVTKVETIPTWVHRYYDYDVGAMRHVIVPLPEAYQSPAEYGLTKSDFGTAHAEAAYTMTMEQMKGADGRSIVDAFAETVVLPAEN